MVATPPSGQIRRIEDGDDDRLGLFLVSVYELCLAAQLGHLQIDLARRSGERSIGVPEVADDDAAVDQDRDAASATIWIDATPVPVTEIVWCTVYAPSPPLAPHPARP